MGSSFVVERSRFDKYFSLDFKEETLYVRKAAIRLTIKSLFRGLYGTFSFTSLSATVFFYSFCLDSIEGISHS